MSPACTPICRLARPSSAQEYLGKLIVLPRNAKAPKKSGAGGVADSKTSAAAVLALKGANGLATGSTLLPISKAPAAPVFVELTDELKERSAYRTLRQERTNAKLAGRRAKKAKEAAEGKKPEGEEKPAADAE